MDSLKLELRSVKKSLADFNIEKNDALKLLRNIETFDSKTVFSNEVVIVAVFAKLFDKQAFSDFRREVKISVDEKIFKLELAYMTQNGTLETLPATEAAIIFNRNKLVDLANNGLHVTSSNANLLVDYLDAFNAENENNFQITYTVPRCGWYKFNGKDFFVDPRHPCFLTDKKAYPDLLNDYCRYMAIITLADALLNAALIDADTLPIDDAIQAVKPIFSLIPTTAEISDTARERDFVLAIIAQNQSRFIGGNVPLDRMQAFYGKLDDPSYIYIVAKFLQDACIAAGFDYRKLVDDLVADGFFAPADTVEKGNKSKLATVQKKIGKANTRCYRIKRSIFDGDE